MISLRQRLVRTLLTALLPIWLVMALASYWSVMTEVDEIYDQQLRELSLPWLPMSVAEIRSTLDPAPLSPHESSHDEAEKEDFAVLLWNQSGELLYRSPKAPALAFSDHPPLASDEALTQLIHAHRWRVLWFEQAKAGRWMAVVRPLDERDELAAALAVGLASPALIMALLLIPLVWWAVARGLLPLKEIGQQVARRRGRDLSRIDAQQVPQEAAPLMTEINALLERLGDAMSLERRFTADASHELRTPLAAARAQIEVAMGVDDEVRRQNALTQALSGLVRASELTEQLLLLARLDAETPREAMPGWQTGVALGSLVREAVGQVSVPALQRGVDVSLSWPDGECLVDAQPRWLMMALGNVLSNALKFTPTGGHVRVQVSRTPQAVGVCVHDSGPGVDPDQLAHLGQRFFRLDQQVPGSGLGLSIAARVMALHQGELRFEVDGGLKVTLVLPTIIRA